MSKRKRTPKERVLARYPMAGCFECAAGCVVWSRTYGCLPTAAATDLACAKTAALAWADAARRLGETK